MHRGSDGRSRYSRVPVSGKLPNEPALHVPDIVSPVTVALQLTAIGIGIVRVAFQDSSSPSTLPSVTATDPAGSDQVPMKLLPELSTVSTPVWSPIGEATTVFHLPSTLAISRLPISCCRSCSFFGRRRPVRPLPYWNEKHRQPAQIVLDADERRAGKTCAPGGGVGRRKKEHQVGVPVPVTVVQVPLLGHHVAHRPRFLRRQILPVESAFHVLAHLILGSRSQDPLGFPAPFCDVA